MPKMHTAEQNEKKYLEKLLASTKWNITKASLVSGLSRAGIYDKIKFHNIQRQNDKRSVNKNK